MAFITKKWIGLILGTVVLVLVLLGLAGRDQAPQAQVVRVVRGDLTASISSNGKIEPIQPFVVRSQYPTFVESISASEGQNVGRGQLILKLNSADIRSQLAQAQADLVAAQEDLRAANAGGPPDQVTELDGDIDKAQVDVQNYRRMQDTLQKLVQQHAATQDELDQNQASLARAQATLASLQQRKTQMTQRSGPDAQRAQWRVDQARAQIAALQQKVDSSVITAPVDGTLYSLPVHVGDYVQVGDILAQMADLHKIRVRAFVDEPDLGWLAEGQIVEVTWDARPGHVWSGVTEQVPRQVVARGNRSVGEVLCAIQNPKLELIPNVNVDVRILVRESKNVLLVPRAAVRSEGNDRVVYILKNGVARREIVQLGISNTTRYEVQSGVNEGDEVILPGDLTLHDGMSVRATVVELPE